MESSLTQISSEVLILEVLPRCDCQTLAKIQQLNSYFNNLCNDEAVWLIKFKRDFSKIQHYQHYQHYNTATWKQKYIFMYRLKPYLETFAMQIFHLGLYLRGWNPNIQYPLSLSQVTGCNQAEAVVSIAQIYEMWDTAPLDIKDHLWNLTLWRYFHPLGYVPSRPSILEIVIEIGLERVSAPFASYDLISSGLYYLKELSIIPDCDPQYLALIN